MPIQLAPWLFPAIVSLAIILPLAAVEWRMRWTKKGKANGRHA
jgi:hypothetical protein